MESLDYWRLCDQLTVVQAALLIVGKDPSGVQEFIDGMDSHRRPAGYNAALAALQASVLAQKLTATIRRTIRDYSWLEEHPNGQEVYVGETGRQLVCTAEPDWQVTVVPVDELREWLLKRGFRPNFFFPDGVETAEYLDRSNPQFSAKLAAAVEGWKAVREQRAEKTSGRSAKSDLIRWLNLHAATYGLTNEEGEPNKQAVEEVAKVANWDTKGGAPKTPGEPVPLF